MAQQLVRWRFLYALLGLIILAVCYPVSQRLEFDRRIESLFAPDDPDLASYKELKSVFGGNAVVLMVYRDPSLATPEGVNRNREITEKIKRLPGVQDVLSTAVLNDAIRTFRPELPFGLASAETLPILFRRDDPVASGFDELFAGYTHSSDHQRAAVVALLNPDHPGETIDRLSEIARQIGLDAARSGRSDDRPDGAVIVGEPVLIHDGLSLIQRDGSRLATLTIVLLSIVLVVSLADLRFVLLTAVTIFWSVVVTRALMVFMGVQLSIVSSVLTAIATVIAVTAVLHLGILYRSRRWRGSSVGDAAIASLGRMLRPIFWTCATDAAGFLALYASGIAPIRQFGLMISVSAIAVFVSLLLFSGFVMMLPGLPGQFQGQVSSSSRQRFLTRMIRRQCLRFCGQSIARPKWCLATALLAGIVAFLGLGRIETDTSFLNNFRSQSSITSAYREVETSFGGAGVWDVVVDAPQQITAEYLEEVRELEWKLRKINVDGVALTKVLSLADAEAVVGKSKLARLMPVPARLSTMYAILPGFVDALLSQPKGGSRKLRIMLRSREQLLSYQKDGLIRQVTQTVNDHTSSETWKASFGGQPRVIVTGYHILMARLVGQLVGDQWRCFAASSILVLLLLALATRSVRLAVAALLPNLLPIFLVLALVGLMGGRINMGAAMIAAVSIGISIDGSVHLLLNYLCHRKRGHTLKRATMMAAGGIGVPVLLATCALILGFGVLATSEFVPTATFGMLVAVTLALGTLVNLTMLPTFVCLVEGRKDS